MMRFNWFRCLCCAFGGGDTIKGGGDGPCLGGHIQGNGVRSRSELELAWELLSLNRERGDSLLVEEALMDPS